MTEKQLCRDCKHLEHDGMAGIWCGVRGNNKNYDCPKFERKYEVTAKSNNDWKGLYDELYKNHEKLEKENKKLKKEYNSLQRVAYWIDDIAYEDREYSERLYKQNQELEKENKRLKSILQSERRGLIESKIICSKKLCTCLKENEQLKKQLKCSREEADDYCEELMGKDEFVRLYKRQRDDALKENEELKADINRLVNETAKVVAEHHGRVLDLIDEKINEYIYKEKLYKHKGKDREASVFNLYCFCLNNLKKELSE